MSSLKRFFSATLTVFCLVLCGMNALYAQVHIAPVAVYLDHTNPSGQVVVHNSSNEHQEVTVELLFAYPDTDDEGNVFLNRLEVIPEDAPSALAFTRVYPRRLVLPPNEQQIIRFAVRPPSGLKPGEYWARPAIATKNIDTDKDVAKKDAITTNFSIVKRTILSLNYRHGSVQTGIGIEALDASLNEEGKPVLKANLLRKGNAAYLGDTELIVYEGKKEIHRQEQEIAVYQNQLRKFEINKNLPSGTYRIELAFDTAQRVKETKGILPARRVTETATLTIP